MLVPHSGSDSPSIEVLESARVASCPLQHSVLFYSCVFARSFTSQEGDCRLLYCPVSYLLGFVLYGDVFFPYFSLVVLFALRSTTMQCVFPYLRGSFTSAIVWAMGGVEHWRSLVCRVVWNFCVSMRRPCLCLVVVALFSLPLEPQLLITSLLGEGLRCVFYAL